MIVLVNVVQHAKIRLVLTFRAVRLGVPIIFGHQSCLLHRNQEKHHMFALIKQPIRFQHKARYQTTACEDTNEAHTEIYDQAPSDDCLKASSSQTNAQTSSKSQQ